jgi:hypothetical protein
MVVVNDEETNCENNVEAGRNNFNECPICLEQYKAGDLVSWSNKRGSCAHIYHRGCIVAWLMENDECPMCRHILIDYGSTKKNRACPQLNP